MKRWMIISTKILTKPNNDWARLRFCFHFIFPNAKLSALSIVAYPNRKPCWYLPVNRIINSYSRAY